MAKLSLNLNVHRIGETFAGMMVRRNFENLPRSVFIAAQDAQTRRTFGEAKQPRNLRRGHYCLNILRHLRDLNPGKPFKLSKNRILIGRNADGRIAQAFVDIGINRGNWLGRSAACAQPLKTRPAATRNQAQLLGNCFGQRPFTKFSKMRAGVTRILEDFAYVRERLMERAAACCRWLNDRARATFARDQSLTLKRAQCLPHGKAADRVTLAQIAFCRESLSRVGPAQNLFAQLLGKFAVTRRGGQIIPPVVPA